MAKSENDSFQKVVERYKRMVYAVAYSRVLNYDDASDITQNVFVSAFLNWNTIKEPSKLPSWLRQVTLNACHTFVRSIRQTQELDPMQAGPDLIQPLLSRLAVEQALSCLSAQTRLTITLYYIGSYSMADIASFLDVPTTSIKSRLRDGRSRLKKEMIDMIESTLNDQALDQQFDIDLAKLIEASIHGNTDDARKLLALDASLVAGLGQVAEEHREYMRTVNADHGWTPLHLAAHYGYLNIVKLLLEYGANIEAVSNNSVANTPISAAAWGNQLEIVAYLLDHGANVNATNAWGSTALRRAVDAGRLPLTELLLSRGADPNIPDHNGTTAIQAARDAGKSELVTLLLMAH